jgi:hypothetical protein
LPGNDRAAAGTIAQSGALSLGVADAALGGRSQRTSNDEDENQS